MPLGLGARQRRDRVQHFLGHLAVLARLRAVRLLTLHRGHWRVENSNHYSRDTTFREDASRMRTGHAPANNAALNNLALAIVVLRREPGETVPETLTRLTVRRERALEVILSPH